MIDSDLKKISKMIDEYKEGNIEAAQEHLSQVLTAKMNRTVLAPPVENKDET